MTSAIDPSVIGAGNIDKAAVQLQLERARDEITDLQDSRLRIDGTLSMGGDLVVSKANAAVDVRKAASGQNASIHGRTGTSMRWSIILGNNSAESGSNAGSDFVIGRYSDAGSLIDAPLVIARSTGAPIVSSPANWRSALSAPAIPTMSTGTPGTIVYVNTASGAGYTTPSAGNWFYFLNLIVTATADNTGVQACGVAGPSVLVASASPGNQWQGFAWRIS